MDTFLQLSVALISVHFLIDFYFQPSSWVDDKNNKKWKSKKLALHSLLHAIFSCLTILFITTNINSIISLFIVITISHWLIDLSKVHLGNNLRYFLLDQLLHILILLGVAIHASNIELNTLINLKDTFTYKNMVIIFGYILILKPSSILIGMVLSKYTPITTDTDNGIVSGGIMIGYLERILILTFIIKGEFAVIGIILAAKSIFRFGELNNSESHKLTEYVLLGSLFSVTLTSIIGISISLIYNT